MPQKDDFLMRLQEPLELAREQAQERAQAGDLKGALLTLHAMQRRVVGLDSDLVARLSSTDLLLLLGPGGLPDLEKTVQCAELLRAEFELLSAQGRGDPALADKALELYLYALEAEPGFVPDYRGALEGLAQAPGGALTPATQARLVELYAQAGAFADAENWLYRWQERDPEAAQARAEAFYRELLTLEDDALERGGLPRNEVEEGLATLTGARV